MEQQLRDTLLISHANPEDNEFTRWLALRLASEGYRVWCDLTKLLGGEVFWDDIETVIRESAAKVIYVLSRTSNAKDGPLRELHLAQSLARREKLRDFVIPAHIDDLPYGDVTIELTRVNAVPFEKSWAAGLASLLLKLEEDGVPRNPAFNHAAVNEWWRSQYSSAQGVRQEPETVVSNWYTVDQLPTTIYEHKISRHRPGLVDFDTSALPHPGVWLNDLALLTFASSVDFDEYLAPNFFVDKTRAISMEDFLAGKDLLKDGPKYTAQILRLGWDRTLRSRLPVYEASNGRFSYYFKRATVTDDTVFFTGATGKRNHRSMVGYKTVAGGKLRYWHYALSGKPIIRPETLFLVKGHVWFSDDGINLWTNKEQMAKARRNQCKNWWNDEWRDRMYGAMSFLAEPTGELMFQLGTAAKFTLSPTPIEFESPVSYTEPSEVEKDEDLNDFEFEDEDTEIDGDVGTNPPGNEEVAEA